MTTHSSVAPKSFANTKGSDVALCAHWCAANLVFTRNKAGHPAFFCAQGRSCEAWLLASTRQRPFTFSPFRSEEENEMANKRDPREPRLLDDQNHAQSERHVGEKVGDSAVIGPDGTLDRTGQLSDGTQSDDATGRENEDQQDVGNGLSGEELDRVRVLFEQARSNIKQGNALEARALGFLRKTTLHVFEAGRALDEAQKILKSEKIWCAWCKRYDIPRTTAWETIQLFLRAKEPSAIEGLPITEAKIKFDICKPRTKEEDADVSDAMVAQKNKRPRPKQGSRSPKSGDAANTGEPQNANVAAVEPTAEELEAFVVFAQSVLMGGNGAEAVVSYLEACQDDSQRGREVMVAAINRIQDVLIAGTRVVEGSDD